MDHEHEHEHHRRSSVSRPGHDGDLDGLDHQMHDHSAHDHSAHDPAIFRRLFWVNLALAIPTLVFSPGLQDILGLPGPRFPGSQYVSAGLGVAIFLLGGRVFLSGAASELRAKAPGMMTLISLAIVVAFGYSLAVTLGLPGMDFWWELAALIVIMLLGHWIEMSAVMGAQNALGELAKLIPDEAEVRHGDHVMTMPVASLKAGDLVVVRPGATVPVDGEVVEGASDVDESLLTGESAPVRKQLGANVVGGSRNVGSDGATGSLVVKVTKVGGDTALAGVMKLVADAQASKSGSQLLADRAAALLFYVALGSAAITFVVWALLKPGDPAFVLERVVTVLVIACPHALGLAIPLVAQLSTAIAARRGILVRDRAALEDARRVDVVLFDKTGTLTQGRLGLTRQADAAGTDSAQNLALAAAVESGSEHPIGRALVSAAQGRELAVGSASKFSALAGRGVSAVVDKREFTVASGRVVDERGIHLPSEFVAGGDATAVYLIDGDRALAMFELGDVVRPESAEAVVQLRARGVRVAMLTGDSKQVAAHVAEQLGITEVFAEVLPGEKADVVAKLQADGARVAMVGDGINDAPALARADIGIAIGAGTDVAIESAGVVLASSDPRAVADLLTLSRASYRKMLQNLAWATGYNAIGLPLAAGVLAGVGFLMPPAVGAAVMSVSTIVVALNAQLLRRVRFTR